MEKELEARYDARKSFYGKARTSFDKDNGILNLYSYNTLVARIDLITNFAEILGQWSITTTRHIKEFLKQNGFYVKNTKQIFKDYLPSSNAGESKISTLGQEK